MKVTKENIRRLAAAVNLALTPAEEKRYCGDLERIIAWVEELKAIDIRGVEPLLMLPQEHNHFVADRPVAPLSVRESLRNAPHHDGAYIHVPNAPKEEV